MATLLPENVPPSHPFDSIAFDIESRYERIVNVVRERKRTLLIQLSEFREEYNTLLSNRDKTEQELKSTKEHIERIKENDLKKMQEKFLSEIEENIRKLKMSTSNYFIQFECESKALENKLSSLGELIKEKYTLPNYSEMVTPAVAVGKQGEGINEFDGPRGIAFDEETQLSYVCDMDNSRVKIISITGESISEFGNNELVSPWGILLHKDSIYVTDVSQCAIFQFNLNNHKLMRKVGGKGSGKSEFNDPMSLAIGPDGDLYVAENDNNRISILDVSLTFKRFIQLSKMIKNPVDIKFIENMILVLSKQTDPRIHFLTLAGEYIRSIISLDSAKSWFFTLDRANNVLINNLNKNTIQVFNQDGILLHIIGEGQLIHLCGIATTRNGLLITISDNNNHMFQIF